MEGSSSLSPLSSPSEITQTWLDQVLRRRFGISVKINTWSLRQPEARSGYLSEICYIKTSFTSNEEGSDRREEISLFAKFHPENEKAVKVMENNSLGEREVDFYKHTLTEEFKVFCKNSGPHCPVPDVYFAELRDKKLTLVLQDMNTDGLRLSVPVEGNSLQQIKSTLAAVAVIHGSGIATIRNSGKHPLDIPIDLYSLGESYLVEGINIQMKILEGSSMTDTLKSLLLLSKEFLTVEEKTPFVNTLIHGDLWTGNVMFSEDDKYACIFDWQFAHIGNLVCDIVSLLLMSGAPETYNEHLTEILQCYWESFEKSLKKNDIPVEITFQDLVRNVESMWMYGYMFFTLSLTAMIINHIDEERIKAVNSFLEKRGVFKRFLS